MFNLLIYLVMCKNSTPYKVGDIVYFMYNLSGSFPVFYEVAGLTKCCIRVRSIGKNYSRVSCGYGSFECTPNREKTPHNEPAKLIHIQKDGFAYIRYYSHHFALRHWDGLPISGFSD